MFLAALKVRLIFLSSDSGAEHDHHLLIMSGFNSKKQTKQTIKNRKNRLSNFSKCSHQMYVIQLESV